MKDFLEFNEIEEITENKRDNLQEKEEKVLTINNCLDALYNF